MAVHDELEAQARALVAERRAAPEAVSVLVVGELNGLPVNEQVARAVAPMVAKREHPTRSFGEVLHIERDGDGNWLAAVEAGARSLADVVIGRPRR